MFISFMFQWAVKLLFQILKVGLGDIKIVLTTVHPLRDLFLIICIFQFVL